MNKLWFRSRRQWSFSCHRVDLHIDMTFARTVVVSSVIYLIVMWNILQNFLSITKWLYQIIAFAYIAFSIVAILSYNCILTSYYERYELTYMRYLIYYQSHHCNQTVDWRILGVENFSWIQPKRPINRIAVERTFVIAILYLVMNCLLLICCFIALCKLISW